jgi:hypothetical protein
MKLLLGIVRSLKRRCGQPATAQSARYKIRIDNDCWQLVFAEFPVSPMVKHIVPGPKDTLGQDVSRRTQVFRSGYYLQPRIYATPTKRSMKP